MTDEIEIQIVRALVEQGSDEHNTSSGPTLTGLWPRMRFSCGGGNNHGHSGIIISLHAAASPFRDKIWPHTGVLSANARIDRIPCHQCIEIKQFYSVRHGKALLSGGCEPRATTEAPVGSSQGGLWRQRHGLKHSGEKGCMSSSATMRAGAQANTVQASKR